MARTCGPGALLAPVPLALALAVMHVLGALRREVQKQAHYAACCT
jgi:hypothetical protein